jgi:hypothetical protein
MPGAQMQLVAYGAQDAYITGNPSITFFQQVYKRHTNFAMEDIQQTINGPVNNSTEFTVKIQRNGDLVGSTYVQLRIRPGVYKSSNNFVADSNWIAERAFSYVTLNIGGQVIDKHYQTWWRLYSELHQTECEKRVYNKMTTFPGTYSSYGNGVVYLPLLFSFCRIPGLYLPLIALQYSEITLNFMTTATFSDYFDTTQLTTSGTVIPSTVTSATSSSVTVWSKYIYLDTDERRRFSSNSHEYLIEQVQHNGGYQISPVGIPCENTSVQNIVNFNHPVKELVWCYQTPYTATNRNSLWNFSSNTANVQVTCNPQLFYTNRELSDLCTSGQPKLVTGTTSNVFGGDGEFGGNFTTAPMTSSVILRGATLTGATSQLTGGTGSIANIQVGDLLSSDGLTLSGTAISSGFIRGQFYFIKTISSTGVVTLATDWSSNIFVQGNVTLSATGTEIVNVVRVTGGIPQGRQTQATNINPGGITTGAFTLNSPWSSTAVIFSNNFNNGGLLGNLFYISNTAYTSTYYPIANTYQTSTTTTEGRYTSALTSNVLFYSITGAPVTVTDNRPVTNILIEDGNPAQNVEVGPLHQFTLNLNGQNRFYPQFGKYFNQVQPWQHHKANPYAGIYAYSFAIDPCSPKPSGTCNFSRIDNTSIVHWFKTTSTAPGSLVCKLFAVNYNILIVKNGMAGLGFSN